MTDTLESIVNALNKQAFDKPVPLMEVVDHLKFLGGHDFHDVEAETLCRAVCQPNSPDLDWHSIAFGCNEMLGYCHTVDEQAHTRPVQSDHKNALDACARLLAVGLLGEAAWQRGCDICDYLHLSKVLYTLNASCGGPYGSDQAWNYSIEEELIERLARYVFRTRPS